MKIGVLALQGDFDAHRKRLEELGAEVVLVKKPERLDEIDGLVIPGGESGTFLKLLGDNGFAKLKDFVRLKPTFGTCAGASCWQRKWRIRSKPDWARSILPFAVMLTDARSTAPSAKADFLAIPSKWYLSALRRLNGSERCGSNRDRRRRSGAGAQGQDAGGDVPS